MENIRTCTYCEISYDRRKSSSTLKMTYCGYMCEKADLGFCIDDLLRAEYSKPARVHTITLEEVVTTI